MNESEALLPPAKPFRVVWDGRSWEVESVARWKAAQALALPAEVELMERAAREGEVWCEGRRLFGSDLARFRTSLSGSFDDRPNPLRSLLAENVPPVRNWLVPGLLERGRMVAIYGNYKSGRSTLAEELIAAVTLGEQGYRFLDHFDPVQLTEEEWFRGVVLINAENPHDEVVRRLRGKLRIEEWSECEVSVVSLREEGGPRVFDVTDSAVYEYWSWRLSRCKECLEDLNPPLLLIVDGMSAILEDQEARYGEFLGRLHQLAAETGIENVVVIGHATVDGRAPADSSGGRDPDALWYYWRSSGKDDKSPRWFRVDPRLSGPAIPKLRVRIEGEGDLARPVIRNERAASPRSGSEPGGSRSLVAVDRPSMDDRVMDYIIGCNADGWGPSKAKLRTEIKGDNAAIDAAVARLEAGGRLERRKRGRGYGLWAVGGGELAAPTLLLP